MRKAMKGVECKINMEGPQRSSKKRWKGHREDDVKNMNVWALLDQTEAGPSVKGAQWKHLQSAAQFISFY